jgi:hypothetical protein
MIGLDWTGLDVIGRGNGGGRGIRTPGTLSGTTVFKTAGINRSPIPPQDVGLQSIVNVESNSLQL